MMNFADPAIAPARKCFLGNETADLTLKVPVNREYGSSLRLHNARITLTAEVKEHSCPFGKRA